MSDPHEANWAQIGGDRVQNYAIPDEGGAANPLFSPRMGMALTTTNTTPVKKQSALKQVWFKPLGTTRRVPVYVIIFPSLYCMHEQGMATDM